MPQQRQRRRAHHTPRHAVGTRPSVPSLCHMPRVPPAVLQESAKSEVARQVGEVACGGGEGA